MTSITSEITNVFETGYDAFSGCENATLYVPRGTKSQYQNTRDWNSITNIKETLYDFCAKNADGVTIYYYIVSEADKTCEVTNGIDKSGEGFAMGIPPDWLATDYAGVVNIPSSANGYKVIGIGSGAFMCCGGLTSLTIPSTVTYIDWMAFYGRCGLTSFEIPNSVTRIENGAFIYSWDLTSVKIPSSVTYIGDSAFEYCENLTSITSEIRNVFKTGDDAFDFCENATLYVPRGTKSQYQSKTDWNRLTNIIELPYDFSAKNADGVTIYYNIVSEADKTCEVTSAVDKSSYGQTNTDDTYTGDVNIPSSVNGYKVTGIGIKAFMCCKQLSSVSIPNSVTSIGNYAFRYCSVLNSLTIGNSVTSIGAYAFAQCQNLTSVTIPKSVTTIRVRAFHNCTGLTSVTSEITNVFETGDYAFYGCETATLYVPRGTKSQYQNTSDWNSITNIIELPYDFSVTKANGVTIYYKIISETNKTCEVTSAVDKSSYGTNDTDYTYKGAVNIPSSANGYKVVGIGESAFKCCKNISSVSIPSSVTSIGNYAFQYCTGLTSVTIPKYVTSIGSSAFYFCTNLSTVTIPNSVTSIGASAFYYCPKLSSVTIPNSVTKIGQYTFYNCTELNFVTIPNSVTNIGVSAFYNCQNLTSLTIPKSVTSIGKNAFRNCTGLNSVTSEITNVFETGASAFNGCENATLYVPKGTKSQYQSKADWNRFTNVVEKSGIIGDINNDNVANISDVVTLVNYILSSESSSSVDVSAYDVDGNGTINISDVVVLVNIILTNN